MNLTWKMEVAIVKSRGSVSYQECGVGPQVELDRIFFRPLQCCDGLAFESIFHNYKCEANGNRRNADQYAASVPFWIVK